MIAQCEVSFAYTGYRTSLCSTVCFKILLFISIIYFRSRVRKLKTNPIMWTFWVIFKNFACNFATKNKPPSSNSIKTKNYATCTLDEVAIKQLLTYSNLICRWQFNSFTFAWFSHWSNGATFSFLICSVPQMSEVVVSSAGNGDDSTIEKSNRNVLNEDERRLNSLGYKQVCAIVDDIFLGFWCNLPLLLIVDRK